MNNPTTKGGPLRSSSRDLVRMVCFSCDDTIRVPADEVRPTCQKCGVLLIDGEKPVNPRAHDFAIEEMGTFRADKHGKKLERLKRLIPVPGGFVEIPFYEVN